MTGRALLSAAALVLALAAPSSAAIYRWVDEDGVVNYSDNSWGLENYRRRAGTSADAAPREPRPELDRPDAASEPASPRAERAVEQLIRLAALDRETDVIAALAEAEFARIVWAYSSAERARPLVAQTFAPNAIRHNLERGLVRRFDPARAEGALQWLRSPLSRRLVELDQEAATPEGRDELVAFVNGLPARPPSRARLAIVHRMDQAGEFSEGSALLLGTIAESLTRMAAPLVPRAALAGSSNVQSTPEETFRFNTVTAILYAYRDVSDADLGRYAAFLESPAGRWFTRTVRAAVDEAMRYPAPKARLEASASPSTNRARSAAAIAARAR